jgi:hypothetical protein
MKAWLSRTQIRQRPMLAVYAGLLMLIAVVIGAASLTWLTSGADDRLAVIGNLLTLGTLLLALVAGIVALAAYSAATGLPKLTLRFLLSDTYFNQVKFVKGIVAPETNIVKMVVENTSKYSARTPAVIVEFENAFINGSMYAQSEGWTPTLRFFEGRLWGFQWDGGPNYSIHGNSSRFLPVLNLQGLTPGEREGPVLHIRLLADGYTRREIRLPIEFIDELGKQSSSAEVRL